MVCGRGQFHITCKGQKSQAKVRCAVFEVLATGRELTVRPRVKQLKEEPHTQKTADAAVGLWTDNGQSRTEDMAVEAS